ncbi:MAG: hypothetical protein K8F25_06045 [Fimbriimonadaceae bacterium]|nr:hypothetical protein [Alphaproteobacteria bacterium]
MSPAPFDKADHAADIKLSCFEDVVRLAGEHRDISFKIALEQHIRPVSFEPGKIEIDLTGNAPKNIANDLSRRLLEWTGQSWMIGIAAGKGHQTVAEASDLRRQELLGAAGADALVQAVLQRFPGAEITDVRENTIGDGEQDTPPGVEDDRNQGVTGR